MIRLAKPLLGEDERLEIDSVLASGYLSRGSKVVEFEEAVAAYHDVKHAISVSSGTAALHLSLLALDLSPSDEVIVPDFTFPATANAVVLAGAKPILCDVRLDSFNLDPEEIMRAISPSTKVIMPVHQFGLAADMDVITNLAQERAIAIVEDAACSLGAEFKGKKCGTFGLVSCFSFHPRKIVTTGEGGVVVTNDDQLAGKIRALRHHGIVNGDFQYAGFNYRMSDLNAALGVAQMRRVTDIIKSRRDLAAAYTCALSQIAGIRVPQDLDNSKHTYQSFVVLLDNFFDRNEAIRALHGRGVEATIGTYAVHLTKFYSERSEFSEERLRRSTTAYRQCLALPMYPEMSMDQVRFVCESLIDWLTSKN
jgi:dTDP-4-amino-4,6-dideoxygalactose transaminase